MPPATAFTPNRDAPYVVGVDLGGTNLRAALSDREGHILREARRPPYLTFPRRDSTRLDAAAIPRPSPSESFQQQER